MKASKTLTSILLAISLALPQGSLANQYMGEARALINKHHIHASEVVDSILAADVSEALFTALQEVEGLAQTEGRSEAFMTESKQLKTLLENFLANPGAEYEVTLDFVDTQYRNYLELYSRTIDISWHPSAIEKQFEVLPKLLVHSIDYLQRRCEVGYAPADIQNSVMRTESLPKYEFDWNVFVQIGDTFSPSSGDYKAYNYIAENKEANVLFDATKIATGVSTGIWAIQGGATMNAVLQGGTVQSGALSGWLGSATSTAGAIAPYAAAAMIVMAVVIDLSNRAKLEKMRSEFAAAEMYKFNNARLSAWFKDEYKKRCGEVVSLLTPVIKDLEAIIQHKDNIQAIIANYGGELDSIKTAGLEYLRFRSAIQRQDLAKSHYDKKCVSEAEFKNFDPDQASAEKQGPPSCFVRDDQSAVVRGDVVIELKDGKVADLSKDELAIIEKFEISDQASVTEQTKLFSKVQGYLRYRIFQMFVEERPKTLGDMSDFLGAYLVETRQNAFERLVQLIGIYSQQNRAEVSASLRQELEVFDAHMKFEARFKQLIASSIRINLNEVSFPDFRREAKAFREDYLGFYDNHAYVPDVRALMDRLVQLEKIMGLSHR